MKDNLDDALLRPGRFNNHIKFGHLNDQEGNDFLDWYLTRLLRDSYVELTDLKNLKDKILNNNKN